MMSIRRLVLPVLALLSIAACKKEEEEATYDYLNGDMKYSIPHYVEIGDTVVITPHGVTHPALAADSIGYTFTDSMFDIKDTVKAQTAPASSFKSFTLVFGHCRKDSVYSKALKDTIGTFSVNVCAYAEDYYSVSSDQYYVVVKEGYGEGHTLWKGFDATGETEKIENRDYYVADIAGKKWLRENLASGTGGCPRDNCACTKNIFGKYYSWDDAVSACPSGWHLSSKAEWEAALQAAGGHISGLLGDVYFNGSTSDCKMWEYWPAVGTITNSTKLSLIPTGYGQIGHDASSVDPKDWTYTFYGLWDFGAWWTSDEDASDTSCAYCAVIQERTDYISYDSMPKSYFAASVRCVKD